MASFYVAELTSAIGQLELDEQESRHAKRVRRVCVGDKISLIDGRGGRATATVIDNRDVIRVQIEAVAAESLGGFQLTIAAALPKGDRQRAMIDMLTQLGVARFVPLICDRSVSKYSDKQAQKFQRYVQEACKQSDRATFMQLAPPVSVTELTEHGDYKTIVWADSAGDTMPTTATASSELLVCVGPEGGFSAAEREQFKRCDCAPVKLAKAVLRTETAAIAAASVLLINR